MSKHEAVETNGTVEVINKKKKKSNLCDVLGQKAKYVVFSRNKKLQVLSNPKDKAIRSKIKKKWDFIGWVKPDETEVVLLKILDKVYKPEEDSPLKDLNARI